MPLNLNQTEHIALALFPDDFHDGSDCRAEMNREGKPCRVCADNRERWLQRLATVRKAVSDAEANPTA
jgi:hypothetical protein